MKVQHMLYFHYPCRLVPANYVQIVQQPPQPSSGGTSGSGRDGGSSPSPPRHNQVSTSRQGETEDESLLTD